METVLKQGDTLPPVLFNLTLDKVVRILQENADGLLINQNKIGVLGFADDFDIICLLCTDTVNAARVLEKASKNRYQNQFGKNKDIGTH